MATEYEKNLAARLVAARTEDHLNAILRMHETNVGPLKFRPVGDRPNNRGTITIGTSPILAIVERVTNMADGMIEMMVARNPGRAITSPREAAEAFFGVPKPGLVEMVETERRELAEAMVVKFRDSNDRGRPTIVVRDKGIGETPARFPKTLLSLNENNKVDKPYTHGTYGQGGAITFGFSKAAIVISRRQPDLLDGGEDQVGWAIVVKQRPSGTKKYSNWEYLVDDNEDVLTLPPDAFPEGGFEPGTQFTHIAYDVRMRGAVTTQPWQTLNAAMFDPVLPFLLDGDRPEDLRIRNPSRVITGNATRLAAVDRAKGDLELAAQNVIDLNLGSETGTARARYWVLRRPAGSKSASDPVGSYVDANSAITMTVNGQRHDVQGRHWIRSRAKFPHLASNLIVEIDATGLTDEGKDDLFAATRENARDSETRSRIFDLLEDELKSDEMLRALNAAEKDRLLEKSTSAASDKVRRRIGKFIESKLRDLRRPGGGGTGTGRGGDGPGTGKGEGPGKKDRKRRKVTPPDHSDDHLPNDPTYLKFAKARSTVVVGRRARLVVEIDAKNNYLPDNSEMLDVTIDGPDSKVWFVGKSALLGGRTHWTFEAAADAAIGAEYKISAELFTPNGLLRDSAVLVVGKQPEPKKSGGEEPETGPLVEWVTKEMMEEESYWTKQIVGRVDADDDETIIWVNRFHEPLERVLRRADTATEARAQQYLTPVAIGLWLQHFHVESLADGEEPPSDSYLEEEKRRIAEAVLVAIEPDAAVAAAEADG